MANENVADIAMLDLVPFQRHVWESSSKPSLTYTYTAPLCGTSSKDCHIDVIAELHERMKAPNKA